MEDQNLTKHSIIMMTSTLAVNFFNYLFQLFMGGFYLKCA